MNVQDRDLERALALLADEVSVTDPELDEAFERFAEESVQAVARKHLERFVAACAAAVLLVGGAVAYWAGSHSHDRLLPARPTTSTQASLISAHELVGTWLFQAEWAGVGLWTFYPDGSGGYGDSATTLEVPIQYTLKGNRLGARDAGGCGFSYAVTGYTQGSLSTEVRDHCGNYGPPFTWVRLSPASPAGRAISMPEMAGAVPVRTLGQVAGVWLMPGTGTLLAIDAADPAHTTYALDDRGRLGRSPLDSGSVTLGTNGTLILTSAQPATRTCSAPQGPRMVLPAVSVLRGKGMKAGGAVTSTCGLVPVGAAWVMVSPR
jgi:hypothetical protein